jgi:hypothetical protein
MGEEGETLWRIERLLQDLLKSVQSRPLVENSPENPPTPSLEPLDPLPARDRFHRRSLGLHYKYRHPNVYATVSRSNRFPLWRQALANGWANRSDHDHLICLLCKPEK